MDQFRWKCVSNRNVHLEKIVNLNKFINLFDLFHLPGRRFPKWLLSHVSLLSQLADRKYNLEVFCWLSKFLVLKKKKLLIKLPVPGDLAKVSKETI